MTLSECSTTKYRESSSRAASRMESSSKSYFSKGNAVKTAAEQANLAENTVRRFFNKILERITEDGTTKGKIGRVGTVVEIYESKFGKRKYH